MGKRIIIEGKMQKNKAMKIIMCVLIVTLVLYLCLLLFDYEPFVAIAWIIELVGTIGLEIMKKNAEKCEITVTDEEIYGKQFGGDNVSIPLNQIVAVNPLWFTCISIKSNNNTSIFCCIKNRDEVLKTITYLLENSSQISREKVIGGAEQLKSLKSLLDANIITQEEFEMKKKEII